MGIQLDMGMQLDMDVQLDMIEHSAGTECFLGV